jgi:hypothetical protein
MNNGTHQHRDFSSQEITKVLARYRSSGLGAMQFAQEQRIPPGRLHYWIYQKGRTRPHRPLRRSVSAPAFQEVPMATMLPGVIHWAAEVSLPGGVAVRFSRAATAQWIGSVVQVLQRPCPFFPGCVNFTHLKQNRIGKLHSQGSVQDGPDEV